MQNLGHTYTKKSIHCLSRIHVNRSSCVPDNPALNPTRQNLAPSQSTHPSGAAAVACPRGSRAAHPSCYCVLGSPESEVNTPLLPTAPQFLSSGAPWEQGDLRGLDAAETSAWGQKPEHGPGVVWDACSPPRPAPCPTPPCTCVLPVPLWQSALNWWFL